jgi:hypothetical protein
MILFWLPRRRPTARELRLWTALTRMLLESGRPVSDALAAAWAHTYASAEPSPEGRAAAEAAFAQHCAVLSAQSPPAAQPLAMRLSALAPWPALAPVADTAADTQLTQLALEGSLLGHLASQLVLAADADLRQPRTASSLSAGASLPVVLEAGDGVHAAQPGMESCMRLLWHAAACFAERATLGDWRVRLQWLRSLDAQVPFLAQHP